ncbi:MAG: CHAT domain-containing tetratricopeptide repeat protein [Bacteroidales bacterium]
MKNRIFLVVLVSAVLSMSGSADPGSFTCSADYSSRTGVQNLTEKLQEFHATLQTGDRQQSERLFLYFDSLIKSERIDKETDLSDAMYLCGVHLYLGSRYLKAYEYFENSARLRALMNKRDVRYRNALTNISSSLFHLGKFGEAINVLDSLINLIENQDGHYAIDNIGNYNNLASCLNELSEFDKSIVAAQKGLEIAEYYDFQTDIPVVVMLYNNLGISHSRRNDYTRALLYLTRAYDLMKNDPEIDLPLYVNIVNSLTIIHIRMGNRDIAGSYYEVAIPVAVRDPGVSSFLMIINYARFFAESGDLERASKVLEQGLEMIPVAFGSGTRPYYDMLVRAASTLSQFNIDNPRALELLREKAIPYIVANSDDHLLVRDVYSSYALALLREGSSEEALNAVQIALFGLEYEDAIPEVENPERRMFIPDRACLGLLNDKIRILRKLFEERSDTTWLSAAVETNRLLISYLETVRIDISEEESRILLGDNYRRVYDGMINDLYDLWSLSGSDRDLRLAFEYAERSKAAGLLVSLREIRASQFLIPDSLSVLERNLEVELGAVREYIANELLKENPDSMRLEELRDAEYLAAEKKSKLAELFERSFPEYYSAKYNTAVASLDEVRKMLGRKSSYINYVLTDNSIFTFVVNRRQTKFIRQTLDPGFLQTLSDFRELLMRPAAGNHVRLEFDEFTQKGYYLYEKLIKPVSEFLTTKRLVISPDNVLAYIPFETLLTNRQKRDDLLYRELGFLLKEFDISYTYSATMYIETSASRRSFSNPVLAFAPIYREGIERDSVLNTRQLRQDVLFDLPYARDEALYAQSLLGGELYLNDEALESSFKSRAPWFPVIHLAMHAIINEESPGYSRLIFTSEKGVNEGLLNTYEIYGIPLTAKMVVVSSCNTGSGKLRAGEGVMSLARGFINAGSQSVIMSLWEVDDRLGSETVKLFYDKLKTGNSKSSALRKAKLEILNGSYQFQAHPYYWSTLVLYGNRGALFFDAGMMISIVLLGFALAAVLIRLLFYLKSK